MQTKNVFYGERPDRVIVRSKGGEAIVELPVNVSEVEREDGTEWKAETVYSIRTMDRPNLKERVEANYEAWLDAAKKVAEPQATSLGDVVEAINALTDLILGGM